MNRTDYCLDMTPVEVYVLVAKGRFKKFPNHYLGKDNIKEIVRHLILNVYQYTREEVIEKVNRKFFHENFLGGARKLFNMCENEILIYSFPEWDLKHWEFKKVSPNFWKRKKNRKAFVCWVAKKEGINIKTKEGLRSISTSVIQKYGGHKVVEDAGGMYELLNTVACGKYKKWEITKMTSWSKEEIIAATKWLIEEKLQYTPEQVCQIKLSDFTKNNLDGMIQKGCNNRVIVALELAYPGQYYQDKKYKICRVH